ncbi:MAG: hypothetical protein AAB886_01980, partial [Patescibacteria group bacterium]
YLFLALAGLFAALVSGCESDTSLRAMPTGLADAVADANLGSDPVDSVVRLHDIFDQALVDAPESEEDEGSGDDTPESDPLEPGEICGNTFEVWNGAFNPLQWQEVSAFPLFGIMSDPSYDIARGETATLSISVTAMCGPIEVEHTFLVVDQDLGAGWNVGPYEAGAEMQLRNPVADTLLGSGASNTLSFAPGDELHYLSYSENSGVMGGTIQIDPILISEGETLVLQYRFGADFTSMVPVGSRFGLSTDIFGWTDVDTGTYIQLGSAYPWAVPAGGIQFQGAELPYMGPGTVYNVVE